MDHFVGKSLREGLVYEEFLNSVKSGVVKSRPKLADLHVILHTSLSGVFNHAMVEKVGADDFIAKFNPDELAGSVQKWLHE